MAAITFTETQKIEIVCEQIRENLSISETLKKYSLKRSTFFYWKAKYFPSSTEERLEERKSLDTVYARVRLGGINKEYFIKDCHQRGWTEGRMLNNIVDVYYSIQSNRPDMQGKEMTEIKKMIAERIKL